jgi:hypothetical protein
VGKFIPSAVSSIECLITKTKIQSKNYPLKDVVMIKVEPRKIPWLSDFHQFCAGEPAFEPAANGRRVARACCSWRS